MPLLTISRITSDEEVAGPSVQTTLVRSMNRYQEKKRSGPADGGSTNCGLHPKSGQHLEGFDSLLGLAPEGLHRSFRAVCFQCDTRMLR